MTTIEPEAPRGYIGRHNGVDDATLALLVDSRVAWYLGDKEAWECAHWQAVGRLYRRGHSPESAGELIRHVGAKVDQRALAVMQALAKARAELDSAVTVASLWPGRCPDPGTHDSLERDAAQEHRPPAQVEPGCCPWCGGRR